MQTFNEQDAVRIIQEMIGKTKEDLGERGTYFLLWGYAVCITALSHLLLEVYPTAILPPLVWPMGMVTAAVLSIWIARTESKTQRVKSYMHDFLKTMWLAFGISLVLVLYITLRFAPMLCYPVVLVFYGLGTFTTGRILAFKPLIWGALSCWILAVITAYLSFEWQLTALSLGVFLSYIIPGHLLKSAYKSAHRLV